MQLMLMMLAVAALKPNAADAHDAGRCGPELESRMQLMLMMLAVAALNLKAECS